LLVIAAMHAPLQADILHGQGLLWKIEKPGLAPSHIYGTMHSGDPRVVNLQPVVIQAFNRSERFAMEMLLTEDAMKIISHGSFFQDERSLQSIMPQPDYLRLGKVCRYVAELPESVYNRMRPWALLMFLTVPDADVELIESLDMRLFRRAQQLHMPMTGLETAEEQLQSLETLNDIEQVWLLNQAVAAHDQASRNMTRMFDAYLDRDLGAMVMLQQHMAQNDSDIDDRFMHALLQQRNPRMVQRMQDVLNQGKAFIAIGALHLPGDDGVLHLLEQQGFSVTPVY
jgi:uncharacterized protein YbaP (TraB family)